MCWQLPLSHKQTEAEQEKHMRAWPWGQSGVQHKPKTMGRLFLLFLSPFRLNFCLSFSLRQPKPTEPVMSPHFHTTSASNTYCKDVSRCCCFRGGFHQHTPLQLPCSPLGFALCACTAAAVLQVETDGYEITLEDSISANHCIIPNPLVLVLVPVLLLPAFCRLGLLGFRPR